MTTVRLIGAFRIRGPAPPTVRRLSGQFMVRDLESTVLYWNDGAWQGSAQRAWDGSQWFPPVL